MADASLDHQSWPKTHCSLTTMTILTDLTFGSLSLLETTSSTSGNSLGADVGGLGLALLVSIPISRVLIFMSWDCHDGFDEGLRAVTGTSCNIGCF